mmetsp:Transcript_43160/g.105584  ORF Transcript_43160/g.105584 Transcript_43160/m.105584 type:complete len:188 (+) Transcript_43160:347-910(+)
MQATSAWVRAARAAPAVGQVARRMASSSSPGHKGKKAQQLHQAQHQQEPRPESRNDGTGGLGGDTGPIDMAKSFPLFKGEGGVIESNKIYIHPYAAAGGGGKARAPDQWAKEAMSTRFTSMAGAAARRPQGTARSATDGMPSAVADALRVGYVGPRFKQLGMPGSRPGEGPGPSVIELEGTIYIVEK